MFYVPGEIPPPPFSRWHLFGPFFLTMYAICILTGVAVATWLTRRRYRERGGDPERVLDVLIWGLPIGLIGARTYHVLTVPWDYFGPNGDPWLIPQIWKGGIAIFGGIIASALTMIVVLRYYGQRVAPFVDSVVPAFAIAQGIGRLGNYFNQELFGGPTTLPWGLRLDPFHVPKGYPPDTLFHPTFLYEMLWNFALAALLIYLDRKLRGRLKGYQLTSMYLMGYGLGRFWVEAMRTDHAQQFLGIRLNGWTALLVFVVGIIGFFWARRHGSSTLVTKEDNPQAEAEVEKDRSNTGILDQVATGETKQVKPSSEETGAPSEKTATSSEETEEKQ